MSDSINLKKEMIRDANVILKSIDFLEILINQKLTAFDIAIESNNEELSISLKKEVYQLLKKLRAEEKEMDKYIAKYTKKVKNEKEKILHNPK